MKRPLLPVISILSFFILFTGNSCSKKTTTNTSAPTLTTQDVILDVTSTSAQSGGTITSIGGAIINANGVVYSSTNHLPTVADGKTTDPVVTISATYTSNLTGLTPGTTYYLRAYASNEFGTGYGAVIQFTTASTTSAVSGAVTSFAGSGAAGYADGNLTGAVFNNPQGIAVDAQGNIYISDTFNNRIRKIATDGTVSTIAGNGTAGYVDEDPAADGNPADAEFYYPQGLALDNQGNIYVADYGNNLIREISTGGKVSTYAGNGVAAYVDGAANVAAFNGPAALAFDKSGNLYVADENNNMIRKITSAGVVSRVAGVTSAGYTNTTVNTANSIYGAFKKPAGIAVDGNGTIYVADLGNSAIRQITSAGVITTIAGGPGQTALVGSPFGLTIDANNNLFITDESGRALELTSTKILYILAGAPNMMGYVDGSGTAVQFNTPLGIAVDANGNIYIADSNNNRIRKLNVVITD